MLEIGRERNLKASIGAHPQVLLRQEASGVVLPRMTTPFWPTLSSSSAPESCLSCERRSVAQQSLQRRHSGHSSIDQLATDSVRCWGRESSERSTVESVHVGLSPHRERWLNRSEEQNSRL